MVPVVPSADDEILERLAARGVIQRGIGKPGGAPRVRLRKGRRSASDIVIEDRG